MNGFLIATAAAAVVLGIVILVHEWGHLVAGKLCGVKVVVFSFGYGPRLWGWKRDDTDYRISAFPLGGYVRMAGDNPVEERKGASDEFLSKPRWQRALVYLAGPTMNVVLAVAIFMGLFALIGIPTPSYSDKPVRVVAVPLHSPAEAAGIEPGDLIVKIADIDSPTWEKALVYVSQAQPGSKIPLVVDRAGECLSLTTVTSAETADRSIGYPEIAPVISELLPGKPAQRAGMQPGDRIVSVDGRTVTTWPALVDTIKGSNGATLHFVLQRANQQLSLDITPVQGPNDKGETVWQVGASNLEPTVYQRLGVVKAIEQAGLYTVGGVGQVVDVVGELLTGKVSVKQLQSVVGIARLSGQAAKRGPIDFFEWIALISINLGVLNLLPIPILDGGNIVMLAIEGALRRDISLAVKERVVQVGLVFLLVIFAIVMYNDVARTLPHH